MEINQQLLFFFSGLGAFNGLLLSGYFFFYRRPKKLSNTFLGILLLALSLRTGKSVLLNFNPEISKIILQIGLTGMFFYWPCIIFLFKVRNRKRSKNTSLLETSFSSFDRHHFDSGYRLSLSEVSRYLESILCEKHLLGMVGLHDFVPLGFKEDIKKASRPPSSVLDRFAKFQESCIKRKMVGRYLCSKCPNIFGLFFCIPYFVYFRRTDFFIFVLYSCNGFSIE